MALVQTALRHMEFYDAALREFEHVDLTFELVVSASCFAQLKRHRMATLTAQPYHPSRGVVVPPSMEAVGARRELMDILERSEETYFDLESSLPHGAEYALTNAHCKRVLWKANAREFYHFSRLREDATAQWDIRRVAAEMRCRAIEVMPLTMLLIGGKDAYPEVYTAVYGSPPKLIPPGA
jgi:thymidylate synthase ThyX